MSHRVSLTDLTVIYTDDNGEDFDLNAYGKPCESLADLRDFIEQLCSIGAFDYATMSDLLAECAS